MLEGIRKIYWTELQILNHELELIYFAKRKIEVYLPRSTFGLTSWEGHIFYCEAVAVLLRGSEFDRKMKCIHLIENTFKSA